VSCILWPVLVSIVYFNFSFFFSRWTSFRKIISFHLSRMTSVIRRSCAYIEPVQVQMLFLPTVFVLNHSKQSSFQILFIPSDNISVSGTCPSGFPTVITCATFCACFPGCCFLYPIISPSLQCPGIIVCDYCNILNMIQDVSSRPESIISNCT
jgi:hypothetical protein